MRRVADALRVVLVGAAGAFLVAGDDAEALKALLVLAPSLAGRLVQVQPVFDVLFTLALAAEAIATGIGMDDGVLWDDTASHLLIPLLSAPVVYRVLAAASAAPTAGSTAPRPLLGAGVATAVGVLALGAAWELVEWGADHAFGTDYSQGHSDTLSDLLADAIAAIAGGLLVARCTRVGAATSPPDLEAA
jgi:hypothetical protein